jgi:5-methylcytosine-specific restriction enzyme A
VSRQEFPKSVQVEIIKRATAPNGVVHCECCRLPTKRFHLDHITADALKRDKRRLTAKDGQLLCAGARETCHGKKTAEQDIPAIAKAKRREAAHLGAKPAPKRKLQSRNDLRTDRKAPKIDKAALPKLPRRNPLTGEIFH